MKYEWYQSDTSITIEIYQRQAEDVSVNFDNVSLWLNSTREYLSLKRKTGGKNLISTTP